MVTVTVNGEPRAVARGSKLSACIRGELPCGGRGKCGKCKVFARGALSPLSQLERAHLSAAEIKRGVRLACEAEAWGDCEVYAQTAQTESNILTASVLPPFTLRPAFSRYGVAVDVGTTTLAATLYAADGNLLAQASALNPQSAWGADVVSRLGAALNGENKALAAAIREAIDGLIFQLCRGAGMRSTEIDGVVITGNTAMLYLLTEMEITPLSRAPFKITEKFGKACRADETGFLALAADTEIYFPPCIAAFVGADTVCAALATELTAGEEPRLLADVGTNGEMALWTGKELLVCSTAAGPAFEGVGIGMGMRAETGAIDRVEIAEDGLRVHVIGNATARGICGSGLVDAVACLLKTGAIDGTGYMEAESVSVGGKVALTDKDIRMVQLAKSAVCSGIDTLLATAGLDAAQVRELTVAGGLGNHLRAENACAIGLFPRGFEEKTVCAGNAALGGATALLLDITARERCAQIVAAAQTVELAVNATFAARFIENMAFFETDL